MPDRHGHQAAIAALAFAAGAISCYAVRLCHEKNENRKVRTDNDPGVAFKARIKCYRHNANVLHLLYIGERLGLIAALLDCGPLTADRLATNAGIHVRYAKEWTLCMAANSILTYDAPMQEFAIKAGIRNALGDETTLGLAPGAVAFYQAHDRILEAYRTGNGIGWGEFSPLLATGARRFFAPLYETHLVPNLPVEVREKLVGGAAVVADIGCGEGISTMVLAKHFPRCTFVGYDVHQPSILKAREMAATESNIPNLTFDCASAEVSGSPDTYDLVLFFDCFHDLPVATAAAQNAYAILKPGGIVFLIELNSSEEDTVEAKLALKTTPFVSTLSCHCCLCVGMCDGGDALGTLVPTCRVREIFVDEASFASLERVSNDKFDGLGFRIMLAKKKEA